jgi:hypothetical protein
MFDLDPNKPVWDKYFAFYAIQNKIKMLFQFSAVTKFECYFGVSTCSMSGVSTDFQRVFRFQTNEPEPHKYIAF